MNLDLNSLVVLLRSDATLMSLLTSLTADRPYYEKETPYAYLEATSLAPIWIVHRNIVTLIVVLWEDWTDKEFKQIVSAFDNAVMAQIDWCLPIKKIWDVQVVDVSKWPSTQKYRYSESKWSLNLRQDYYFDVTTV